MNHSRRDTLIGWALVGIQLLFIGAIVLVPRDAAFDGGVATDGAAWALIGLAGMLGVWGFRHLGDGLTPLPLPNGAVDLVTSGPYRWMRHPIYTAVMVGMGGIALRTRTPLVIAIAVGLAAFLWFKARWEEGHLRDGFPGYVEYAHRTAMFVPLRPPRRAGRPGPSDTSDG
jgi:protein-S-isoprenylcysteine O-methyltransferase Ste14